MRKSFSTYYVREGVNKKKAIGCGHPCRGHSDVCKNVGKKNLFFVKVSPTTSFSVTGRRGFLNFEDMSATSSFFLLTPSLWFHSSMSIKNNPIAMNYKQWIITEEKKIMVQDKFWSLPRKNSLCGYLP